ncbi:dipeptidase [Saccharibacter floricola]|uniref:Dipeptidase n=1 Tax=Saccharibacter floricola DSM 15669 TaxID=1123227 RepID=A0ABQ0NZX6_9PROT|nr:dipeptidase [Saccharibacter floricola]GBQ07733.1 dipeptidase [Saccharibacter floricola DSM 15669]
MTQKPLITFDTHIDIPWPERTAEGLPAWVGDTQEDLWKRETTRRFTVPKAQEGKLTAACLAAYIPQFLLTPEGYEAAWKRVQAMLEAIHTSVASAPKKNQARLCVTEHEIREAVEKGMVAIVPVVENGYAIGEDPSRIAWLAQQYGVRYMTLTHNGHNQLADAAVARGEAEKKYGGLSTLGREVIAEMNRHAMVVDVSHTSKQSMMQATELSRAPVLASHSCVRALCDHPRNLDDEQLDRLRDTGGLLQVTAMGAFLKRGGGGTLETLIDHITYTVERIGVEHVGFSSDFDGGGGIDGWEDASQTASVIERLKHAGFDESERRALCGENMMRLLKQAENVALQ